MLRKVIAGLAIIIGFAQLASAQPTWGWGNNDAGPNGDHGALGTGFLYGLFPIATTPGSWPTPVIAFAGGKFDSAAITCRGWMYTCGDNQFGQLGNGNLGVDSLTALNIITQFPPNTSILALPNRGGSTYTNAALDSTGHVWMWGQNTSGQTGTGSINANADTPGEVMQNGSGPPLANVKALALGSNAALALACDGTVWSWGPSGGNLQLGRTNLPFDFARQISTIQNVKAVSASDGSSVASKSDGTVWTWGNNSFGELGRAGGNSGSPVQVRIPLFLNISIPLTGIKDVASGYRFNIALTATGNVVAWGDNSTGQLGQKTFGGFSAAPKTVMMLPTFSTTYANLDNVVSIASAGGTGYALRADGTIWSWGAGQNDQLGNGNQGSVAYATQVKVNGYPPAFMTDVSAGDNYALALEARQSVWGWGLDSTGQIGNGTSNSSIPTPLNVQWALFLLYFPTQAASGRDHSVVRASAVGMVQGAGANLFGQLGNGNIGAGTATPGPVMTGPNSNQYLDFDAAVSAGAATSYFLRGDGRVWAAGDNSSAQLGIPFGGPYVYATPTIWQAIVSVVGGDGHAHYLLSNGNVLSIGANSLGQLGGPPFPFGNGSLTVVRTATGGTLSNIVEIACGDHFCLARRADGTVWAWGDGASGQLGNGGVNSSPFAVQVMQPGGIPLSQVRRIACGGRHGLAITGDGTVWAWGSNSNGQCGTSASSPVVYATKMSFNWPGIEFAKDICGGESHSVVLCADGLMFGCGSNANGQVGDGSGIDRYALTHVSLGGQSCAVSLGLSGVANHTLILGY